MSMRVSADPVPGIVVSARGDLWTVFSRTVHADCTAVHLRGASSDNRGTARTFLQPFDRLVPIPDAATPRVVGRREWNRGILARIARSRPFGGLLAAASANLELLPFQLEPALATLRHGHTRILIADQVGLGKTVQAILVIGELSAVSESFRGVVLSPAALLDQWTRELDHRMRRASMRADARWLLTEARRLPPDVNPWSLPGLYVASIDLVKRPEVLQALEQVTWDIAVVDEAHSLGAATARLAAADAIAARSTRLLLLTATPPDGNPAQMAALCSVGQAGDPLLVFRRTRSDIGYPSRRKTTLLQIRLTGAERRMHRLVDRYTRLVWSEGARADARVRLAATLLRKRALSTASSLRTSVERRAALIAGDGPVAQQLPLPLGEEDPLDDDVADMVLGLPGMQNAGAERRMLGRIARQAAAASRKESKIRALVRYLRRARQPAIVFTEYRDTLSHLDTVLRASGHSPVLLHGGMHQKERNESVRTFEREGSILLATDAASEGLNLHRRCRLVVHFELPWTPARIEQRTGRVDRLGQAHPVHEVLFVARDTAERLVLAPLLKRAHAAAAAGARTSQALLALTEPIVAACLIAGDPIPLDEDRLPTSTVTCPLEPEAQEEVQRLQLERRHAGTGRIRGPAALLITAGRARGERAPLTVVMEVVLRDAIGRDVHGESVAMTIHAGWKGDRQARGVREFVDSVLAEWRAGLLTVAQRVTADSLSRAERHFQILHAALERRDAALLRRTSSTAQRLVQAGLFDGRSIRRQERERISASLMTQAAEDRATSNLASAPLSVTVRVAGIRVGRSGAR